MKFIILTLISFSSLLVLNGVKAISDEVCHSQNDPHIRNYFYQDFEFQKVGTYCMYDSKPAQIEAQFQECTPGSLMPTCNCRVKIQLLEVGDYAEVDTCSGGPITNINTLVSGLVTFPTSVGTDTSHPNFIFENTVSYYSIKTTLPDSNDDVEVRIYPDSVIISRIEIFASNNYVADNNKEKDCCLCGNHFNNYGGYGGRKREVDPLERECKDALIGGDFFDKMAEILGDEIKVLDDLVKDCIKDEWSSADPYYCLKPTEKAKKREIGRFQKSLVDAKIYEALSRKMGTDDTKEINSNVLSKMSVICANQNKRINSMVKKGYYSKPLTICV